MFVDEELTSLFEPADIDDAVEQLRMGGGDCWVCHERIDLTDDVSLVAHATGVGVTAGFVHFTCAPVSTDALARPPRRREGAYRTGADLGTSHSRPSCVKRSWRLQPPEKSPTGKFARPSGYAHGIARGDTHPSDQRTTLVLDVDALARAREVLGTRTTKETVNRALREVSRQAALRRAAALVRQGGLDIIEPEDLPELRRDRTA